VADGREDRVERITTTGLDFRLMTRWTSFVAVEERIANDGGLQHEIVQPVELPEGVDYDGVFGMQDGLTGSMRGSAIGNSFGVGGLGTRGSGAGGGGVAYGMGVKSQKLAVRPRLRLAAPAVTMGSLAPDAIRKVIRRNQAKLRSIYERVLTRNPSVAGKIVVTFVVGADGRVKKAKIKTSTLGDTAMENQILVQIKKWRFPRPAGGGVVEVNYPFVFSPGN